MVIRRKKLPNLLQNYEKHRNGKKFNNTKMKHICIHHIGGRGGNRAFPVLGSFEKDFVNVLYDADKDCIAQIEDRNKKLQSKLIVLPYCIGEKNKERIVFNITYDPFASSLREFNEEYDSWFSILDEKNMIIF